MSTRDQINPSKHGRHVLSCSHIRQPPLVKRQKERTEEDCKDEDKAASLRIWFYAQVVHQQHNGEKQAGMFSVSLCLSVCPPPPPPPLLSLTSTMCLIILLIGLHAVNLLNVFITLSMNSKFVTVYAKEQCLLLDRGDSVKL